MGDIARVKQKLHEAFIVESFPHSLNISQAGSDLRVQIQTDQRYAEFLGKAQIKDVLGRKMPVAAIEDVLMGKVWAASDPSRRGSKTAEGSCRYSQDP